LGDIEQRSSVLQVLELRIAPVEVGIDARLPAIVWPNDQWRGGRARPAVRVCADQGAEVVSGEPGEHLRTVGDAEALSDMDDRLVLAHAS
jgi:hypothetical protein